jgi:hypothetical protein
MLSEADNEVLTRTGRGTQPRPGDAFRVGK